MKTRSGHSYGSYGQKIAALGAGVVGGLGYNYARGMYDAGAEAAYQRGRSLVRDVSMSSASRSRSRSRVNPAVRINRAASRARSAEPMRTPNSRVLSGRVNRRGVNGRIWRTTGRYMGRYQFRSVKRRQIKVKKMPVIIEERLEDGGVQNGTQTVAVALTTSPRDRLLLHLIQAIYRCLHSQMIGNFQDWNAAAPRVIVTIQMRNNVYAVVNCVYNRVVGDSHFVFCQQLAQDVVTEMSVNADLVPNLALMIMYTDDALTVPFMERRINLGEFTVAIEDKACLTIQNRTIAESVEGGDADLSNNVSNNPLTGFAYMVNPGQMLIPKNLAGNSSTFDLTTDPVKGFGSATYNTGEYIKPPKSNFFQNVGGSVKVILGPGAIKKFYMTYISHHSLRKWFELYSRIKFTLTDTRLVPFGKTVFVYLEKMLDTRTDEPNIEVGFQTDLTMKVRYYLKKNNYVNPYMNVGLAPV